MASPAAGKDELDSCDAPNRLAGAPAKEDVPAAARRQYVWDGRYQACLRHYSVVTRRTREVA
jgi:hypothetical protein